MVLSFEAALAETEEVVGGEKMEIFGKIKAMNLGGDKKFRILLLAEVILLLVCIVNLFGKDAVYRYPADMREFEGISLPKGTYRVKVYYDTDVDGKYVLKVTADDIGQKSLRFNSVVLYAGWHETNEEMWLLRDTEQLNVRVIAAGEGNLAMQGLTIEQTNAWNRICLFVVFCLITMVNLIWVYRQYDRLYAISVQSKTVTFLLGVVLLFASIPLMLDYMWSSGDLGYHLMRVEGIKDGILNGQFPIRISPEWQQGYGYASPIFYGETVLYVAALFRLIGFSVTTSYRLFMLLVTVATILIAYFCFKKIFGKPYIGVFCSALYTLSVYRIYKTYTCGSWGECFGVMFLPLIVYGFYRIFSQDIREESYKRSWLPLTIGFTMLLQSHLLTCEMVGFFTVLLCIVLWKKVFRAQTFLVLAKTVIYTILLSAWFLVPFLDYMLTGDFVIHHVSARTIQERGLYPAHILFTYFSNGGTVLFKESGMYHSDAMGPGIVLIVALAFVAYLLFTGKLKGQDKKLGKIVASFAVLAMLLSLNVFPWDRIQALNRICATLVSSIQFPNRFLTIANVCLTVVAGIAAKYFMENETKERVACFYGAMVLCLVIGNIYFLERMIDYVTGVQVYNEQGMGTGYISGAEYLPYGTNAALLLPHDPKCSEEISVSRYKKKSLGAQAYFVNSGSFEGKAAFALLYYKGYRAYDMSDGTELNCYPGENGEVTVDIPAGYEGMAEVRFVSPRYWRAGEMLTLLSAVALAASVFGHHHAVEKKRGCKNDRFLEKE